MIEGIQTETQGVLTNLATLMYATGLTNTFAHGGTIAFGGGYSTNQLWRQRNAQPLGIGIWRVSRAAWACTTRSSPSACCKGPTPT